MAEEKPWVYNTMLLDLVVEGELQIVILNLQPIKIEERDGIVYLEIRQEQKFMTEHLYAQVNLAITNDPFTEAAGDWVDLGYGRFRVQMKDVSNLSTDGKIHIACDKKNYQFEVLLPERPENE